MKKPQGRQKALQMDANRCIGCYACEVACKLEHDFPAGPHPIHAIQVGPLEGDGELLLTFQPTTCYHCDRPACVDACPTGAMQKREDGVVFSDLEICIGCQTCAIACPFGVPQLNPATGKIAKCDACKDRIDQGLWPVCALCCPTGALQFAPPSRLVQDIRQREALRVARCLEEKEEA
jgi:Fe-S-cluster-containing dehydrogenase component